LNSLKKLVGRDVRSLIVKQARWGVANEPRIHYREARPMPLTATLPLTTDCSGFVTLCFFLAGAPDPNGLNYNGQGYTGTLLAHGQHIPLAAVKPGDAVVYGPGTGWHTALVVEAGHDPLTVSHGQEAGPQYCRVSQDGRLPQTYLRFPTNSREAAKHVPHAPPVKPKQQPHQPKPRPRKPAPPPPAATNSTSKVGDHGDRVRTLQRLLKHAGFRVTVDGVFGKATLASVRAFQKRHGLKVDGQAGPRTWAALNKAAGQ